MTINNRRDVVPFSTIMAQPVPEHNLQPFEEYTKNSSAPRAYTDAVVAASLRKNYPKHHLTVTTSQASILAFAEAGHAQATILGNEADSLIWHTFTPPARRSGSGGVFHENVGFAGYKYVWEGNNFIVYVAQGVNGNMIMSMTYILTEKRGDSKDNDEVQEYVAVTNALIEAATRWGVESHDEILVFDGGYWQKNKDLYASVQKANWEDVILEEDKKKALVSDIEGFFASETDYKEFSVPWKRGVIFHGPPGNGKTISIKAMMHSLMERTSPTVELLYVKTLQSMRGTEASVRQIFLKARTMAPCLLVFEDIDSLVDDRVRSYFLNEVDGLESNHGILMIGSTNHLERLDPGIAKRPSRFDRKYFFDVPTRDERVQYCQYWKHKLRDNKKVQFPMSLCGKIADITEDFSFAYLKEAFVGALLVIVREKENTENLDSSLVDPHLWDTIKEELVENWSDPEKTRLWQAIQEQVKLLREELEAGEKKSAESSKKLETVGNECSYSSIIAHRLENKRRSGF